MAVVLTDQFGNAAEGQAAQVTVEVAGVATVVGSNDMALSPTGAISLITTVAGIVRLSFVTSSNSAQLDLSDVLELQVLPGTKFMPCCSQFALPSRSFA